METYKVGDIVILESPPNEKGWEHVVGTECLVVEDTTIPSNITSSCTKITPIDPGIVQLLSLTHGRAQFAPFTYRLRRVIDANI